MTVTVTAPSKLSVHPTSLRFNSTNWSRRQAVRLEALHDSDTSDEKRYVTHSVTDGGGNSRQLDSVQVEVTDDDDGEDQIGARPSGAVWWAALTARSEVDGLTGHINYTGPEDTGKLSSTRFTQGGAMREIEGLFVNSIGNLQLWVDSGDTTALPNSLVLHVGNQSLALGSASRQSFKTVYTNPEREPTMRDHTYWWFSGTHSVSLSDREVVAVWLEAPSGSELPGAPMSAEAQARDGGARLEWVAPPEVPSKPVTSYEYQQEGTEEWTSTNGTATTEEVTGLANGESYSFRVRAVNAAGKGAASAPSAPVTPTASGLTAAFASVPEAHDGSSAFTLQLEFSEDVAGRFRRMRNDIFEVTGGAVTDLRRVDRRRDLWTVTVAPSSDDAVTVSVPAGRACDVSGAVCTAAGERLSSQVEATVPGPLPAVSVSAGADPVTEGTAAEFTLTRTGDTAAALTVAVSVSEDGAVLAETASTEAVFAAGAASVDLSVATEDDEVAGDGSVVTVALEAGAGYTLDADASSATVTVEDDDAAPENAAPTGLPTIAGTARVGETLTASASDIADADGLTNAVFAWQWLANDGTADTDFADATEATYTLTAAEAGKTIKVRATFTDDAGTEETLVSEATAAVAAALPVVSIAASTSPVTEGASAAFTLSRTGDAAAALTVAVSVSEAGSVLSGTPASTVTFAAGSAEAALDVATDDDSVAEADARVTVSVSAGSGYGVHADAGSASVDVYDNDEAATTTAVETLWTSTLIPEDIGGVLLGYVGGGNALSPDGWSEDGAPFRVEQLYYFPQFAELAFGVSAAPAEVGQLTLHLDDVQVQLSGAARQRNFYWTVADLGWQAGQPVAVKLTREDPDAAVVAGPGLSAADAQVREAEGAVLAFGVTLEAAQPSAVSVRFATSNGTAVSGSDYEAVSGSLRFEAGETAKTVSVPVLNDSHDEGSETLTLTLSRPFGAEVADGEATGTIVNTGPMPHAWIARFGRTVGLQAVEAIGDRLSGGSGGTEVVVGGVALGGSGAFAGTMLEGKADWQAGRKDMALSDAAGDGRGVTGRELLLGSSFQFSAGGEDGAMPVTAWGRFATSSFAGREDDLSLSGDVTTGFLGADVSLERWLAGVAVGLSEGEGSFDGLAEGGAGRVESSLTSVFPYARLDMGGGVDAWGLVGIGSGDLRLTVGEEVTETGLGMQMGAFGLRSELVRAEEADDFGLALKTDAMWVRTESDAARSSTGGNLEAASGDVSRVRVAVEGSQSIAMGSEATFTPTVELGLRHDAGDAETGTGVEAGVGLLYSNPAQGLTVEGRVRGLLTHADSGYEEWGASGSVRLDPGISGRGVSLTLAPVWGAASGGVEQLWSTRPAAGLAVDDESGVEARLEAELGYGFGVAGNAGVLTPYAGFSMANGGDGRTQRVGMRWRAAPAFQMELEGRHGEADGDTEPATSAILRAAWRW